MIDFLIIGGGVAGISAAAKLANVGKTVVLEAEDVLGFHASGRSAAMYLRDYGNPAVRVLNYASHAELEEFKVLKQRRMIIPSKKSQRAQFNVDIAELQLQEISGQDALEICPILDPTACAFAGFRPDVFDLDTDLLMQNYIKSAKSAGADIHSGQRVTKIAKSENGWTVSTSHGQYETKILVNAGGAWADNIALMAGITPLEIIPYRRSIARMPAPDGHDVSGFPFMIGVGESWFAKPDAGKWLVSPAEAHQMEPCDAYADDMVLAEGIARYQEMVTPEVTRIEGSWAGLRTFAPDRTLVVGRDVNESSFFWLAGQGGYGFQSAPAASLLVADLLAERAPSIGAENAILFAPERLAR
jgi:glycine/D-amino acid oxidase-like deaminating enzyme